MEETTLNKVLDFVNKLKRPMSIRQIAINLEMSTPTAQKYIDILNERKKINIEDYKIMKLISPIQKEK